MASQVHQAATAGEQAIVEPGLVGTVGVMKNKICRINVPQVSRLDQVMDFPDAVGETVGEIDR